MNGGRHYYEDIEFGKAIGNVVLRDTVNEIVSTSRYAETDQRKRTSFVTDSVLVRFVHKDEEDSTGSVDTLYLHADSVVVTNDSTRKLQTVQAHYKVKVYRGEAQAMCDSLYYSATDSIAKLYRNPVVWYQHYQTVADTIEVKHDSAGAKVAYLRSNGFCIEQLDREKNRHEGGVQVELREGFVVVRAVVLGNDHARAARQAHEQERQLGNFKWRDEDRPKFPLDVFRW